MLPLYVPPNHASGGWAPRLFAPLRDALRDHWLVFLATWVLFALAAAGVWLALPAHFVASSSLLMQMKTTDPIAGIALPGGVMSNFLTTQQEVMQSEKVALLALRALTPQEDQLLRRRWQESTGGRGVYESWAAESLLGKTQVRNARDSNVLVLSFKDRDPERAARFANALVQAYLQTTVDLRQQPAKQYSSFFDEKLQRAKESLEAAQNRLIEFQQRNGLASLDERADVEERRLADLAAQITLVQSRIAETRGKEGQGGAASQEAVRDPVVVDSRIELAKQEALLTEFESRLGAGHPQLLQQRQLVAQRRASLGAAIERARQSIGAGGRAEAAQLATLKAAYDQQQSKVLGRKTLREEAIRMQKSVDNLQRNYELLFNRLQTTTLESEDVQPNVSILKVATPPPQPAKLPLPWFVSGGALLGLVIALALVFVLERMDARLRYADHVVQVLQAPFLVQLPFRRTAMPAASPMLAAVEAREASHEAT